MKKIILDTNFLTVPYQFKVDIFEEINRLITENYEITTLNGVIKELQRLSIDSGKDSIAAKIGLSLIKMKNVKVINSKEENVDNAIIEMSDKETIVATNDKNLIKRLKDKKIPVIYLRSKNRLMID